MDLPEDVDSPAARLRAALQATNRSASEIARICGFSRQNMQRFLDGDVGRSKHYPLIARTLNVPLSWLLTGDPGAAPTWWAHPNGNGHQSKHQIPAIHQGPIAVKPETNGASLDSQAIEILGRSRLIEELLRAGLEVALPIRDRGVDLIAYADRGENLSKFAACPIQMKAASGRSFSINAKYAKFPNLIHAFVWQLAAPAAMETYALTQSEAIKVGESMGYTLTASWKAGVYSTQQPSRKLLALLEPYRMNPEAWRQKIIGLQSTKK